MAVPSNRTPSPLSSSRRMCHQSRNSADSNSAARRSFSGNPFPRPSAISNPRNLSPITPANSPSGIVKRNSLSNLHGWEEKENDKGQSLKPFEPAKLTANGSKSFMAPTISAASKFTPSPRKKVLVERNDPVRTSISLSEGKSTFFFAVPSESSEDLERKDGECDVMESLISNLVQKDAVSKSFKRVTFSESPSGSDVITGLKPEAATISSNDCGDVVSDSKNTISCFSVSPVIAPLDADPCLPPYDPKTNFLSPRPQFLHYRPNPRIENLLNKEKELELGKPKRLQDNFMLGLLSASFSDSEGTEESHSEDSQRGSEDSSSSENLLPEGTEDELHASESVDTSIHVISESSVEEKGGDLISCFPISHGITKENAEQEKEEGTSDEANSKDMSKDDAVFDIGGTKSSLFEVLKYVSLLLVLLVTCVSIGVIISPFMHASVLDSLKSSKLPDASEIGILAKENFNHLSTRFQKLSLDSISHFTLLIHKFGGGNNLGHIQFMNLTMIEYNVVCPEDQQWSLALSEDLEEEAMKEEEESETESIEETIYPVMVFDDNLEWDLDDDNVTTPTSLSVASISPILENLSDVEETSFPVDIEKGQEEDYENHEMTLLPLASSVTVSEMSVPESAKADTIEADMNRDSLTELESASADTNAHSILEDVGSEMLQALSFRALESLSVK